MWVIPGLKNVGKEVGKHRRDDPELAERARSMRLGVVIGTGAVALIFSVCAALLVGDLWAWFVFLPLPIVVTLVTNVRVRGRVRRFKTTGEDYLDAHDTSTGFGLLPLISMSAVIWIALLVYFVVNEHYPMIGGQLVATTLAGTFAFRQGRQRPRNPHRFRRARERIRKTDRKNP